MRTSETSPTSSIARRTRIADGFEGFDALSVSTLICPAAAGKSAIRRVPYSRLCGCLQALCLLPKLGTESDQRLQIARLITLNLKIFCRG